MPLGKTFLIAAALALVAAFAAIVAANQTLQGVAGDAAAGRPLRDRVVVREQVALADIAAIKSGGIKTIVDLRPDGEAPDQPSAAIVGEAVRAAGMNFVYVPTPHGDIPDAAVDGLARTLATAERPMLLYCRSGKRAARTWALAEASRKDGPSAAEIATAVSGAGQTVDDIAPLIAARIAARGATADGAATGGATPR